MAIASDKLVFLHIPKTGGMWVSYAMKRAFDTSMVGHQHSHFPQLLQLYDEKWYKQRFIFTMVRHPITWYQSRWAFRVKHGWRIGHPLDFACATNDFHSFVEAALDFKPDGWLTWEYGQYIDNVPGGIDYVAKLENGVDEIMRVLDIAGVEYDPKIIKSVPRVNDSDMGGHPSKYWAKYTPELFDRVMAVENRVIAKYYSDYEINPNDHIGPRPW
tara:strand:- start:8105 stop:8749 length:645 start_codon:yes stop_codon:yes gene_type:complete